MKNVIRITGQLNGNLVLRSACTTFESEESRFFDDFVLTYPDEESAVKALYEAYKYVSSDTEDWEASCGSYQEGVALNYDASVARIEEK